MGEGLPLPAPATAIAGTAAPPPPPPPPPFCVLTFLPVFTLVPQLTHSTAPRSTCAPQDGQGEPARVKVGGVTASTTGVPSASAYKSSKSGGSASSTAAASEAGTVITSP